MKDSLSYVKTVFGVKNDIEAFRLWGGREKVFFKMSMISDPQKNKKQRNLTSKVYTRVRFDLTFKIQKG